MALKKSSTRYVQGIYIFSSYMFYGYNIFLSRVGDKLSLGKYMEKEKR
jgi:hypothetical protein